MPLTPRLGTDVAKPTLEFGAGSILPRRSHYLIILEAVMSRIWLYFTCVLLLMTSLTLGACSNSSGKHSKLSSNPSMKHALVFKLRDKSQKNTLALTEEWGFLDAKKLEISVKAKNSPEMLYNNHLVGLTDAAISEPLSLPPGTYEITKFGIVDSSDKVILAAPLSSSPDAFLVVKALPIEFIVGGDNPVSTVEVEVISTEVKDPKDFGYSDLTFKFVETLDTALAAFAFKFTTGRYEATEATVSIVADAVTLYRGTLINAPNQLRIKDKGEGTYVLKVKKDGYAEAVRELSRNEIRASLESPLRILLHPDHFKTEIFLGNATQSGSPGVKDVILAVDPSYASAPDGTELIAAIKDLYASLDNEKKISGVDFQLFILAPQNLVHDSLLGSQMPRARHVPIDTGSANILTWIGRFLDKTQSSFPGLDVHPRDDSAKDIFIITDGVPHSGVYQNSQNGATRPIPSLHTFLAALAQAGYVGESAARLSFNVVAGLTPGMRRTGGCSLDSARRNTYLSLANEPGWRGGKTYNLCTSTFSSVITEIVDLVMSSKATQTVFRLNETAALPAQLEVFISGTKTPKESYEVATDDQGVLITFEHPADAPKNKEEMIVHYCTE
jgi:hypothetical protein